VTLPKIDRMSALLQFVSLNDYLLSLSSAEQKHLTSEIEWFATIGEVDIGRECTLDAPITLIESIESRMKTFKSDKDGDAMMDDDDDDDDFNDYYEDDDAMPPGVVDLSNYNPMELDSSSNHEEYKNRLRVMANRNFENMRMAREGRNVFSSDSDMMLDAPIPKLMNLTRITAEVEVADAGDGKREENEEEEMDLVIHEL
jgi:hypothetical protein